MWIIRLCLAVVALGAAGFFGYAAYGSLAVATAAPGTGSPAMELLGVTVSFGVGLSILGALALASALFAVYLLFSGWSDS